jgi:multiple sugar transport system ATP-binding protein
MAEIVLDQVTKRFADGTEAVKAADFTIADGEFFILVGPSGCGKSTLLNMIVGLEDISDGTITVDGDVVNDVDPKDRNMAMVFQSYAIYPHMTVRQNIAFPLTLHTLDKKEIDERVQHAADILQLDELLDRKPANLSGGQRQRVAMGRAIVREPAAFLMDEPLSNLDAKLRVQMRTEISRLQSDLETTTVYVTHDQTEALTLGDRVAVLRRGEVQQVGTPRELYTRPANLFVAGFIGSPAMNFFPAEVDGDTIKLPMVELTMPEELRARVPEGTSGSLVAGLRPENFEDAAIVSEDLLDDGERFTASIDVVEWLGAELYAYFTLEHGAHDALAQLTGDLASEVEGVESGADRRQVVARLDVSSQAAERQDLELWLDARALHLFDGDTGECLTSTAASAADDEPAAAEVAEG